MTFSKVIDNVRVAIHDGAKTNFRQFRNMQKTIREQKQEIAHLHVKMDAQTAMLEKIVKSL